MLDCMSGFLDKVEVFRQSQGSQASAGTMRNVLQQSCAPQAAEALCHVDRAEKGDDFRATIKVKSRMS